MDFTGSANPPHLGRRLFDRLGHISGISWAQLGRISGASRAHAPADARAEALDLGGVGAGLLVGDLHERLERRVDGLAPQLADVGDRVVRARRAVLDVTGAAAPVAAASQPRLLARGRSAVVLRSGETEFADLGGEFGAQRRPPLRVEGGRVGRRSVVVARCGAARHAAARRVTVRRLVAHNLRRVVEQPELRRLLVRLRRRAQGLLELGVSAHRRLVRDGVDRDCH